MKLQQFPYEIAAASHSADASQQQCRGAMINWPGALLMLRHYRFKSLWEHITIMFLAMSQFFYFLFFPILERHPVNQRAHCFFCVFFEPRVEDKDTVSRISKYHPRLCFSFFFYSFFFSQGSCVTQRRARQRSGRH